MKIKFKNGSIYECTNPVEQKIFKNGESAGWICSLGFTQTMNSGEVDALLTLENISQMAFLDDEDTELFNIDGYSKITSAIIRHGDEMGSVNIQLAKSVEGGEESI